MRKRANRSRKRNSGKRTLRQTLTTIAVYALALFVVVPLLANCLSQCSVENTGSEQNASQQESTAAEATAAENTEADLEEETRYNEEYRPYYAQLSDSEREAYRQTLEAMLSGDSGTKITAEITPEQMQRVYDAIVYDQPSVFWIESSSFDSTNNIVTNVSFTMRYTGSTLQSMRDKFDSTTEQLIASLRNLSAAQQEKSIYDALATETVYDEGAPDDGQTAYNAIVEKRSVCAGYARAFQHLMISLGTPCYYVRGNAENFQDNTNESHAWNIVKTDYGFYNVDPTWADSTIFNEEAIIYSYFNATDDAFSSSHTRSQDCDFITACENSPFPFEDEYGMPSAEASLQSTGESSAASVTSVEEYRKAVKTKLEETADGQMDIVLTTTNMSLEEIESAHDLSFDNVVNANIIGSGTKNNAVVCRYDESTFFAKETYSMG